MSDTPAITALAPWFGGKRTLAPVIVEELGGHRAYFEPFCGGCSVLWGKPVSSHETINDLHGDLINLAMVLASDRWADLYNRLGDSEREHEFARLGRSVAAAGGGDR